MLTVALVFVFVGIVFIFCGKQLSETLDTFSEKSLKEVAKHLGDQSIPKSEDNKVSAQFIRLIGVVIMIIAIVGIFFINMLQQGN
jgi:Fe2+ transport system protein B